jgi:hypothetical protein
LLGVFALTVALIFLISPLIAAGRGIWNIWTVGSLCVSTILGAGFIRLEQIIARRGGNPLVTTHLFRSRAFTPGIFASLLSQSCLAAFILVYTLHMQFGMGFSALSVGVSLGGAAVGYTLASLATSLLMKKWGMYVTLFGSGVVVLGYSTIFILSVAEETALTPFAVFMPLFFFCDRPWPFSYADNQSGIFRLGDITAWDGVGRVKHFVSTC